MPIFLLVPYSIFNLYYITSYMISQFIGFLFFIAIAISGFWYLIIFINLIPYWIIMGTAEIYGEINKEKDPDLIKRKILSEKKVIKILHINT